MLLYQNNYTDILYMYKESFNFGMVNTWKIFIQNDLTKFKTPLVYSILLETENYTEIKIDEHPQMVSWGWCEFQIFDSLDEFNENILYKERIYCKK